MAEGSRSLPAFQPIVLLYVKSLTTKAVEKSPFRYPDTDQFHFAIKQHIIIGVNYTYFVCWKGYGKDDHFEGIHTV